MYTREQLVKDVGELLERPDEAEGFVRSLTTEFHSVQGIMRGVIHILAEWKREGQRK